MIYTEPALYARTNERGKRLAIQGLTNGIEINEDERATIRLSEPFAALAPASTSSDVRCSSSSSLVEPRRFELLTSALQRQRSTN